MIPYGRQSISQADMDAVQKVLEGDYLTQGPAVTEFETALCQFTGFSNAIAVNSATSALHAACLALGVEPGSRVWVPANSFVASANCARYCGAEVTFIDVEVTSGNLCMDSLMEALESAESNSELPDVVIAVHYAGHYCDLLALKQLSKRYGFLLIEDASHALGAELPISWQGMEIEEIRGDICVYSFHPVKMITSGEGGAALCEDQALAERIRLFANHGIVRGNEENLEFINPSHGGWYYEQQVLGYNFRMSDIHAALGFSQLQQLPGFLDRRRAIAQKYEGWLDDLGLNYVDQKKFGKSSYHLFSILAPEDKSSEWFSMLRKQGVGTQKHYIPIPMQPYYLSACDLRVEDIPSHWPGAWEFYQRVLALPMYPQLTEEDQATVIRALGQLQ